MNGKRFYGKRTIFGDAEVFIEEGERPLGLLLNQAPDKSPQGFEWGCGGSGSFALAKSILHEIDPESAEKPWLVDAFKWNVIAAIVDAEWSLTAEQVENFVAQKTANM